MLQLAGIGVVLVLYLVTTVLILYDGTILNGLTAFYLLVVIMAALLISNRSAIVFLFLSLAAMLAVLQLELKGIVVADAARAGIPTFLTYGVSLVIALILLWLANSSIQTQVFRVRMGEKRQAEISVSLEDANRSLQSSNRALGLAIEVARRISQVRDPSALLGEAVELIRSFFELAYTQIYLLDPSARFLTLKAGSGSVGLQLVARGHRLPLTAGSINGTAAVERRFILVPDTAESTMFRPNPLLPGIRFEVSVPLIVGEKLVGVLDLQGSQTNLLSESDIPALEALAGQLAIAIQNAGLFEQLEISQKEIEAQARRTSMEYWHEFLNAIDQAESIRFEVEDSQTLPLTTPPDTLKEQNILETPIQVFGCPIGNISLLAKHPWTEEEKSLAEAVAIQVSQQVENLRVLADAQRSRAQAEQVTRRATNIGWKEYLTSLEAGETGYIYNQDEVLAIREKMGEQPVEQSQAVVVQNKVVGEITLSGIDDNASEENNRIIATIAQQLGAHIENLRLFAQTQATLGEISTLYQASSQLAAATNLDEMLAAVAEGLHVSEINRLGLMGIVNDAEGQIRAIRVLGSWYSGAGTPPLPAGTTLPREQFPSIVLLLSEEPVFYEDAVNDPRADAAMKAFLAHQNIRSMATLPLRVGGAQIGSLLLEAEVPHRFTPSEIRSYPALAGQLAVSVQNRQLLELAQTKAFYEQKIREITAQVYGAASIDAMLRTAAKEIGQVLGKPAMIYLGKDLQKEDTNGD